MVWIIITTKRGRNIYVRTYCDLLYHATGIWYVLSLLKPIKLQWEQVNTFSGCQPSSMCGLQPDFAKSIRGWREAGEAGFEYFPQMIPLMYSQFYLHIISKPQEFLIEIPSHSPYFVFQPLRTCKMALLFLVQCWRFQYRRRFNARYKAGFPWTVWEEGGRGWSALGEREARSSLWFIVEYLADPDEAISCGSCLLNAHECSEWYWFVEEEREVS